MYNKLAEIKRRQFLSIKAETSAGNPFVLATILLSEFADETDDRYTTN